jgi:hypothetical protein
LPGRFSEENSAVLPENTAAEIFCGGFTAEIPPDTRPRSLIVALSLSTGTAPEVIESDNFASSTGEILDAPSDSSVHITEPTPDPVIEPAPEPDPDPVSEPEPAPEPAPSSEPEPAPEPEPAQEPASEPAPDPGPVSRYFISVAHAQEVPEAAPLPAEPEPVLEEVVSHPPAGDFLEVRYTFDGSEWHTIDTLDVSHAASQSFSVPLPEDASWSDLSAFQVSVRAVASVDATPKLYLDGMRLDIAYESMVPDPLFDPLTGAHQIIFNASAGFITATDRPATTTPPTLALIDTLILSDASQRETGLVIYDEVKEKLLVDTVVGNRKEYAHAASSFGEGRFIILQTLASGACARSTLAECRTIAKGEWAFVVVEKLEDAVPEPSPEAPVGPPDAEVIAVPEHGPVPAPEPVSDASIETTP